MKKPPKNIKEGKMYSKYKEIATHHENINCMSVCLSVYVFHFF